MISKTHLDDRLRFLQQAERNLALLKEELLLKKDGWQFRTAADFAAIHSYMYKDSLYDSQAATPFGAWSPRTFARDQLMLSVIFSEAADRVLLIPPYSTELMNHLQAIRSNAFLAAELLKRGRFHHSKLAQMVNGSNEYKAMWRTGIETKSGQEKAIQLAQEFFPEMYALLQTLSVDALGSLRGLFSRRILVDVTESLPELDGFSYETDTARADWWYRLISTRRKGERLYATFMDGLACAYLERASRLLTPRRIKLLFVSPSTSVAKAISYAMQTGSDRADLPVLRDYHYFMLKRMYESRPEQITEAHASVRTLLRRYRAAAHNPDSADVLESAEHQWRQCENLIMSGSQTLEATSGKNANTEIARAIWRIYETARERPDKFSAHVDQLIESLRGDVADLQLKVADLKMVDTQGIRENQHENNLKWVVLPAMKDDFRVALRIDENRLRRASRALPDRPSEDLYRSIRIELKELLLPPISQERYVFAGYLSAVTERYDDALSYLEKAIECKPDTHLTELGYVSAMVCRKLHKSSDAEVYIDRALMIDPEDSRLLIEASAVYWLKTLNEDSKGRDGLGALKQALSLAEAALAKASRDDIALSTALFPRIHNTLTFLLIERVRRTRSDVNETLVLAESYLSELAMEIPEELWTSRFFDTRAWLNYTKALLLSPEHAGTLLTSAMADVTRALEVEDISERHEFLETHRATIAAALTARSNAT